MRHFAFALLALGALVGASGAARAQLIPNHASTHVVAPNAADGPNVGVLTSDVMAAGSNGMISESGSASVYHVNELFLITSESQESTSSSDVSWNSQPVGPAPNHFCLMAISPSAS
jgi:hypothetical protein